MKPLYYSALAPPQVAPALAFQAQESLRPVIAYLNAAKAAAKEREVRSRVQWTAVPVERTIQLHASDSLLEIAGEGGGYDVVGWSGPAPSMPLFVGAQFRPVQPVRVDESGGRVVVWLAEVLSPDELVFWAGIRCQLQAAAPIWPTQVAARRADGRVAQVLHREEVGGGLRIVVEGTDPVTLSTETGAPVSHRVLVASDGAIRLRGNRTEIEWNGEHELHVAALPDTPTLLASNGVRWTWQERVETSRRRRGVWIQLLAPDDPDEIQADSTIDARAAFCDEGIREVRTKKGGNKGDEFRVFGFRRDTYRLELDRLPPEGSTLFLPSKLAGLNRQLNAVYRLKDSPLPHHRGLLTLCEDPTKVRWPDVRPEPVTQWHLLADDQWDGTVEQREFVSKALATNDFAFLEGPPGSGKTHAICELVLQLVERQQRVLLCSTTHVAVDNVLERLITKFPQIEAIRVGLSDRVDPRVRSCQLDERVERLAANWKSAGAFSDLDDQQLDAAAESIVLAGANLTCGTTTGILSHPYIRRVDAGDGPSWPHFDVLIIDEASKTTFQEFLVPAQLARKWIIVGDVRQLPPFTDPRDLEASLADVSDEAQRRFPPPWQRACLLRFKLGRPEAGAGRIRWLIEESVEVLDALMSECAHTAQGASTPMIARIVERATRSEDVTVRDLETGQPAALRLAAADWVLLPRGLRSRIERYLPAHLLPCSVAGNDEAARFRRAHWLNATGRLQPPVRDGNMQYATAADVMAALQEFFGEETWASQVAWRLGRVHQLASARNDQNRLRRQAEVDALMPVSPAWQWVETATDAIRDVGVRSVIESLRVRRVDHRVRRKSALTEAIPDWAWKARSVLLTYQHRMHQDISALPRELFYEKTALRDANTLTGRDAKAGWNFLADAGGRRVWLDVAGTEERGVNRQEVTAMEDVLRRWVASAPPRRADGQPWEIACLSFYSRQELAIRDMLRRLTGQPGAETRFALPNAAIVGGTVDRFQGREADMVLLSLRNTRRTGHLDSPNRLNVAITRARFMLVIIGHRSYFTRCPSEELTALAAQSPVLALGGAPMKAALHADVELWEVSAFAELAVWDRRPELQRVLAAVPERGVLTSREIDQALPGLSATASRNVLKHLAYLRLTDDQGALTALSRRCVATGEAPSWELGAYAFLIALNPLFQRQMLGFRRLASDARDLDFNGLQPVPAWFEADPARTWASAFAGDPAFTLFSFTSQRGLDPRCRLAELDPARLAWVIDLGTGENGWNLEGEVGGKNDRTTFRTRPESVAVEKVRGMFATWDDRWDAKAARLAMPYDGGAAGGHDTFERTLRYPKVTAGEAGTFLDVQVEGVPVGPNSTAEAQRWALDLVLARVEAAGTFCTTEEWRSHWTAAIGGTPLEARASQCPDPDAATRPDGRPLRPRTRWLLSAARDLAVE